MFEKKAGADGKGVTEVDCLMCHLNERYNNEDRDYCMTKPGMGSALAPKLGATMGLTYTGEVSVGQVGAEGINPTCTGINWSDGILDGTLVVTVPKKENCALCHFPEAVPAVSKGKGPGHAPLDWTAFQKFVDVNKFVDSDIVDLSNVPGACDVSGNACTQATFATDCDTVVAGDTVCLSNALTYDVNKGRAEFGKRGESINDSVHNPDAHMDASSPMTCSVCHYNLSGDFPALIHDGICSTDGVTSCISDDDCGGGVDTCVGDVVQIAKLGVGTMDHQFAKGNNIPDGKNSDQLDNTVTCEGCHIDQTHPNSAGAPVPTHPAFPAFHMDKISCRACHIPETNFMKKKALADFSTTPYPLDGGGIGRGQFIIKKDPVTGKPVRLHYKPIYGWLDLHGNGDYKIIPIALGAAAVWKDLADGLPYSKRFATKAATMYRDVVLGGADSDLNNIKDFSLNNKQNGDAALIANTTTEIDGMVGTLRDTVPDAFKIQDPALNIFVNVFTSSHNVAVASKALGSQSTGACAACHSADSPMFTSAPIDTNPLSACYNQPEGCKGMVFFPPTDGGVGLEMTCDGGDCSTGTKRITNAVGFKCPDGSKVTIDLTEGVAHGDAVNNVIPQEDVLCYAPEKLANLKTSQSSSYFANLDASYSWVHSISVPRLIAFDGTFSKCPPGQTCAYSWDYNDGTAIPACDVGGTDLCVGGSNDGNACSADVECLQDLNPRHTYATAGTYGVTLTVTDEHGYSDAVTKTVTADDLTPPSGDPVAAAADTGTGGIVDLTVTAGGNNLKAIYVIWGDGSSYQFVPAYDLASRTVSYTYAANATYDVTVVVFDMNGNRFNLATTVAVTSAP